MPGFTPALFTFLTELAAHNDRDWFNANKARYKADVEGPLADFVVGLAPRLQAVDPEVIADKKSLFRIYRDTRFSTDKSPYKTHASAQFQRGATRGPGGTGYYLHLEPGSCFFVGGNWMPEPAVAARIRAAIDAQPAAWIAARDAAGGLHDGESLVRVPKPFAADHPLAADLRRKSFTAWQRFSEDEVVADDFGDRVVGAMERVTALVRFLSAAG